jgi:hypothetical protein
MYVDRTLKMRRAVRRLKVTVTYADGRVDVVEADHLRTEAGQWRLEIDKDILLIPFTGTRSILMSHTGP